jgi:hypothetical protein
MTKLNTWVIEMNQLTGEFYDQFGALSEAQLNWKLNESTWCIAQVLEHIILVNTSYFRIIEQAKKGTLKLPWIAKIPFVTKKFGNMILRSVKPQQKAKTKTMSVWQPGQSTVDAGIITRFARHQLKLIELMRNSEDLIAAGAVISSPANRYIVYTVEKLLAILLAHEKRHFLQAKRILEAQP